MKFKLFAIYLLFLTSSCSTQSGDYKHQDKTQDFLNRISNNPYSIWKDDLSPKTKQALKDYQEHRQINLKNAKTMEYGESVRKLNLRNRNAQSIEKDLNLLQCTKKIDHLKDVRTHRPLHDKSGKTIPMLVFLCPDGGVVRLKAEGDPTSKFRPQPHASKALRFPYNGPFENFDDEILKVDNIGNAVPKWAKDLKTFSSNPEEQKDWIEAWANDAHTDLTQ